MGAASAAGAVRGVSRGWGSLELRCSPGRGVLEGRRWSSPCTRREVILKRGLYFVQRVGSERLPR